MATKKNPVSFLKKPWVSSISVFLLSQIIFIIFETTGWMPYRDFDEGTLYGKIVGSPIFTKWFAFYEEPHMNLLTVFFGIFFLVPGIIGTIKNIFVTEKTS